jgi:hypothetical protein
MLGALTTELLSLWSGPTKCYLYPGASTRPFDRLQIQHLRDAQPRGDAHHINNSYYVISHLTPCHIVTPGKPRTQS